MTFGSLRIGDKFTTDRRLLDIYWLKTKPVKTMPGSLVNAVAKDGHFVFFADQEEVNAIPGPRRFNADIG